MLEELEGIVKSLIRTVHDECEDCFYSCPKSEDYCRSDVDDVCTCGMDYQNERLNRMLEIIASLKLE